MHERSTNNCIREQFSGGMWQEDLWVLVPALLAGLLTHGAALVNKYSFHDDIYELFAPGQTFIAGRWVLGLMAKAEELVFGTTTLSLPLLNGVLGIVLLAIAAVVLVRLYAIHSRGARVLCGCAMVVMPSVVSMMGFMFTVQYYALGFLLAVLGAAFLCTGKGWKTIAAGILCIILALGIYQAALPLVCGVMVLYYMQSVLRKEHLGPQFWLDAIRYCLEVFAAIAVYGGIALVFMRTLGGTSTTTEYAGLSEVGHTGLGTYLSRVVLAYREFLLPTSDAIYNQYPAGLRWMYLVLLVILAVLVVLRAIRAIRGGQIDDTIHYVLLALLLPLCIHLIYVMTDLKWIHTITVYAEVLVFYLLAVEIDACADAGRRSLQGLVCMAGLVVAGLMMIAYVRYGNLCYLKAEFLQHEAISYLDRLITRIQSVEGYDPAMPVVYLNEQNKQADSLYDMAEFSAVVTSPYNYDTLINDYAWQTFMKYWNNYDPIVYPAGAEDTWSQEIQDMPRYPEDGSIQIFEPGYIVVKF